MDPVIRSDLIFCYLWANLSVTTNMNQKDIIIKVLKKLGGRGTVKDICLLGKYYIGDSSTAQTVEANIRRILNSNPNIFRHPMGVEQGEWELVSYKEEIAKRDYRIKELQEEIAQLRAIKTEDDFVKRLVRETKNLYKHEKVKIEVIRQILYKVGRGDAEAELDAWIEGREYKTSLYVEGDYVVNKNVNNEVNGVASGATGVNMIKEGEIK